MKEHIQRTIEDIRIHIANMTFIRARLLRVFGDDADANAEKPAALTNSPRAETAAAPEAPGRAQLRSPRTLHLPVKNRKARSTQPLPTVCDAARAIIAGWAGPFKSDTLAEQIVKRWPGLANKVKTGLATNVAFLVARGELAKLGKEGRRHILQRTAKLKAPTAPGEATAAGAALLEQIHAEEAAKQPAEE